MWTKKERELLAQLDTPEKIQSYLDRKKYNRAGTCSSPRYAMRSPALHCAEGAYLAYAARKFHGQNAGILDLIAVHDVDHLAMVFKQDGLWGAVAKSNTSVLRFRAPVYRSLRELAMSYFDAYLNGAGERTLRAFGGPYRLEEFRNWQTTQGDLNYIGRTFDERQHTPLIPEHVVLPRADRRLRAAVFYGAVLGREGTAK